MKIMICGTGQSLVHVTNSLLSKGYQLTLVSPDKDECSNLARDYKASVIHGNPTRERVLRAAGITENNIVISMFPNDEDNYIMALLTLRRFSPVRIVSLVNHPANVNFFKTMGVHVTLSVPDFISSLVEEGINEDIINLQPLEDGELNSMLIIVREQSPINGKKIQQLPEICESKVAAVLRNGRFVDEEQTIKSGDKLLILVAPTSQGKVIRDYTGQR